MLDLGHRSDVGRVRSRNEDSYYASSSSKSMPGITGLLIVADGLGGHQAGGLASKTAVEVVRQGIQARLRDVQAGVRMPWVYTDMLQEVVLDANRSVYHLGQSRAKNRGMGTTVTVALIDGQRVLVAGIGDSRAYLISDSTIHQLTEDDSLVAEQIRMGLLTPEQARRHPRRNVLTKALGTSLALQVDIRETMMGPGNSVVLCSDGLTDMMSDEEIRLEVISHPPQEACDALVDAANERGGIDNITVVVATLEGRPL